VIYPALRSLLFRLNPETAHALTLQLIRLSGQFPPVRRLLQAIFSGPDIPVQAFGLTFRNPVGLAAGYDKDGLGWRGLASLGFGHIEVGTVTPLPQPGNPKPRLFRLPEDQALINRMGFPGHGADFLLRNLRGKRPQGLVLGVNIGKNKGTPLEKAADDYLYLLRAFAARADYLAVNVSSPNTEGLRALQARRELAELLSALAAERRLQEAALQRKVPLLVKIAPDLSLQELEDALQAALEAGIEGVIATNTTLSREGLHSPHRQESGGLSGAPLNHRAAEMVAQICQMTGDKLVVIAAGGVMSAEDARLRLDAGASLVQVYTGLVYQGPGLVKEILKNLAR